MINKKVKMKAYVLVLGIVMFVLLSVTTVLRGDLVEDFLHFQIFRNQLKVNSHIIKGDIGAKLGSKGSENVLHELDLSIYVLKDSPYISFYRFINSDCDNSMTLVENSWAVLTDYFLHKQDVNLVDVDKSLNELVREVDVLNKTFVSIEFKSRILYITVLLINLIIFVILLVVVYYITNVKERTSTAGVMSVRNALIRGQEQERLRISLELHDKVAQDLFASKMIINDLASVAEGEDIKNSFKQSLSLLDMSIKEVRDLSYSLRPPALQAIGLDSAIQSYIDNFSKKIDTPISFKAVGITNKNFDETVSINLYRILQETLNNTAKHAHANSIDIKLIFSYPFLLLKIEDDGVGFNYVKSEMKAKGREKLGLPGINERVSLLGGELIINSNKGEGTKILIKVPVESNEEM